MSDQIATALIERMQPVLYFIGLFVVLGLVAFGGTIISLWWNSKQSRDKSITDSLAENTIAIARVEAKLDLLAQRYDKDLNALGNKLRRLEV